MSSSIPSWQILTAHAQPFRGARDLAFCLKVPLGSLLAWASSKGSGETARMRRLAWTFAARIGDKYRIRLTRSNWWLNISLFHLILDVINWLVSVTKSSYLTYRFDDVVHHVICWWRQTSARPKITENITLFYFEIFTRIKLLQKQIMAKGQRCSIYIWYKKRDSWKFTTRQNMKIDGYKNK